MGDQVMTEDGAVLPVVNHKVLVTVPAAGALTLRKNDSPNCEKIQGSEALAKASVEQAADGNWILSNDRIRAVIDEKGEVVSFVLLKSGREYAGRSMNHFRLFKDIPRKFDAWDIDSNYTENEIEALTEASVTLLEQNELEAVLLLKGTLKNANSALSQKIILRAGQEQLFFETEVDWHALHRLLKVSFPVNVVTSEGVNEIQYGYVKRPTVRSRAYDKERFEVCNHRYTALFDGSHGAAVLNDSKYGISMEDNRMELSLLRAATAPAMRSDNGLQKFTYALTVWEGSFEESCVVRKAISLNEPLQVVSGAVTLPEVLRVEASNIILDAVKLAEDGSGDVIVRMYESMRCDTTTKVRTRIMGDVSLCSILEREKDTKTEILSVQKEEDVQEFVLHFAPFEVKTIRIHKPVDTQ